MIQRRSFLAGLLLTIAAPRIVRAASIMPISSAPLHRYVHWTGQLFAVQEDPMLFYNKPPRETAAKARGPHFAALTGHKGTIRISDRVPGRNLGAITYDDMDLIEKAAGMGAFYFHVIGTAAAEWPSAPNDEYFLTSRSSKPEP